MDGVEARNPAPKAARIVVRGYLDAAVLASRRLSESADPEALHDVRVAIRRLRVALRAYASELKPGVPKGLRKALSALAALTTGARDTEVFIEWLRARIRRLPVSRRSAARWLIHQAEARRDAAYRALRRQIPRGIAMFEPLLRAALAFPAPSVAVGDGTAGRTFGARSARVLRKRIEELSAALGKIRRPDDDEAAHEARIAAKKVRYLLEPVLGPLGASVVKPIKALQSTLGEFHDLAGVKAQVFRARRSRSGDPALAPTRARLAGLPAVIALADREHRALFLRIQSRFLRAPRAWLQPAWRWIRRHEVRAAVPRKPRP